MSKLQIEQKPPIEDELYPDMPGVRIFHSKTKDWPTIAEQQAYWLNKEKEQDDLAADTRMDRLSERDYDDT